MFCPAGRRDGDKNFNNVFYDKTQLDCDGTKSSEISEIPLKHTISLGFSRSEYSLIADDSVKNLMPANSTVLHVTYCKQLGSTLGPEVGCHGFRN